MKEQTTYYSKIMNISLKHIRIIKIHTIIIIIIITISTDNLSFVTVCFSRFQLFLSFYNEDIQFNTNENLYVLYA